MRAHELSNLLNEFGKRDKMQGLQSILSLFCNKFNKLSNTGLDLSYDIKITLKSHILLKKFNILCLYGCHYILQICKPLDVYRFEHDCVISLPDVMSCDKTYYQPEDIYIY